MEQTEELARKFSEYLLEDIGEENLATVVRRNAKDESRECCATHDFCDSNMTMLSACENLKEPVDIFDAKNDQVTREAWDMAYVNEFYTKEGAEK